MAVVSGGMAEALVSTGLGIFVAIPAVVAYNHFTGNLENFRVEMNRASSQLVNHLFKVPELMAREARLQQESEIVVREEAYARR
jgi:biopolymer transport protein ExbB/TolQ